MPPRFPKHSPSCCRRPRRHAFLERALLGLCTAPSLPSLLPPPCSLLAGAAAVAEQGGSRLPYRASYLRPSAALRHGGGWAACLGALGFRSSAAPLAPPGACLCCAVPCSLPRGDHSPQCHFVFFQLPPELLCRLLYRPSTQPQPGRVRTYPSLPAAAAAARPAQILHVIPHAACLCDLSTAGSDPGSTTRGLEQAGACLLGPPRQRRRQHGKRRPQQTCTPVDIILQPLLTSSFNLQASR